MKLTFKLPEEFTLWARPKAELGRMLMAEVKKMPWDIDEKRALRLVRAGADLTLTDGDGWNPLMHAIRNRKENLAVAMTERMTVEQLDWKNMYGQNPLLLAGHFGRKETAGALLAKGVSTEAKDGHGHKADHLAREQLHKDVAQMIVAAREGHRPQAPRRSLLSYLRRA